MWFVVCLFVCFYVCLFLQKSQQKTKTVKVRVRPYLLFRVSGQATSFIHSSIHSSIHSFVHSFVYSFIYRQPSTHLGSISPDSDADFQLFDRVLNVKLNASIPFGLRGTIIGIHQGMTPVNQLFTCQQRIRAVLPIIPRAPKSSSRHFIFHWKCVCFE